MSASTCWEVKIFWRYSNKTTPTIIGGLKESEPLPALGPLYSCPNSTAFISLFHTAEVKTQKFEFMKFSRELRERSKKERRRRMSTTRAVLLIACALLAVAFAKSGQQDREKPASEQIQIPAGKENLPAEHVFKNIEILKGKPASRLPGMMKVLNELLGVECTYCHVVGAWEKEEPEAKRTARRMFKIVGNVRVCCNLLVFLVWRRFRQDFVNLDPRL